ncbi:amidohydrolase family protein [Dactylosporangium sp. CA-233914]|uniref:amidohydrolase family protein n=1 Tax=Dactylosporangium sp. CA-233914 TaxID=3239934 RepID=UPI003D90055B
MSYPADFLIEHGLVIDGSGNPGFHASVAVRDGVVEILRGDTSEVSARERIDATGKIVAPGFIDIHSHSDLVLLQDRHLEMKVRQGVTTEVSGSTVCLTRHSQTPRLSRSMQLRVPMLAGPAGFLRWWVELGGSP